MGDEIGKRSNILIAEERLMTDHECRAIDTTHNYDAIERNIARRALAEVADGHSLDLKTAMKRLKEGMENKFEEVRIPNHSPVRVCVKCGKSKRIPDGKKNCLDCEPTKKCADCNAQVTQKSVRCRVCAMRFRVRELNK